jgi:hypothetical protein
VGYLKSRDDVENHRIGALAYGEACLPLIHAAAFDHSIRNVALIGSPISYRSIAMNRFYKIGLIENEGGGTGHPYEIDFSWGIAGVLRGYDLPDLIGCIAPRKVVLADLHNQRLEPASAELIDIEAAFPWTVYKHKNAPENLRIISSYENLVSLVDWCFE